MLHPIIYLALLVTISVVSALYAASCLRAGVRVRSIMFKVGVAAAACIFVLGIPAGTFRSHGFDVPWWAFGLLGGIGMLLAAVAVISVSWLYKGLRGHNKAMRATCETHARDG
jgi:hypothetical protein